MATNYGTFSDPNTFQQMLSGYQLPAWLSGSTAAPQPATGGTLGHLGSGSGILGSLFGGLLGGNKPVQTQPTPQTPTPVNPGQSSGTSGSGMGGPWNTSPWHTEFANLPGSRQDAVFEQMSNSQYTPEDIAALSERYRLRGVSQRQVQGY